MASELANKKIKLNNGVWIPIIANGSYAVVGKRDEVKDWTLTALKNGYRHIDTALGYGTEKSVGAAIRESGIPREEIFVTTKLPWSDHARVKESFEESLANLGLDYIDLYLVHWPQAIDLRDGEFTAIDTVTFNESWAEFENLLPSGKVRAIGVSNFSIKTLEQLFKTAKVVPAVNQVELHPYLAQNELRDYCSRKGIAMMAYTPSGYAKVRSDPLLGSIAEKYNVTPNQVTLAWHICRNTIVVPKSENNERQKENISIPTISEIDLAKVWFLDRGERICNKANPITGKVFGWSYEQLGWEDYRPKL